MTTVAGQELDRVRSRFSGRLITAADDDYDQARSVWNGSIDVLPDIRGEHGGVIGVEHVLMLKSPARRSRAGLGVQGVAGMVSLSR
jgi:hypothetical protein